MSSREADAATAVPPPPSSARDVAGDISATAQKVAADVSRALAEGRADALTDEAIQALMAAACRSYSARVEATGDFPPLAARSLVHGCDGHRQRPLEVGQPCGL
jgi:hypothetical protein